MPILFKNLGQSAPICLTIAGSDSGGGAGIQADLKTFSALGVYGASVITALTAQNTRAVTAVFNVPADIVAAQMRAVLDDLAVSAIKIGMLASSELIEVVAHHLDSVSCPCVLDPVMVSKSGDSLLETSATHALRELLLPKVALITPNLPEAACLLSCAPANNEEEAEMQGRALLDLGVAAVLMKGGHATGDVCVDLLIRPNEETLRVSSTRIHTRHTHGTGCTMSSAIAAGLAHRLSLQDAFIEAHGYVHAAIAAAERLSIGSGRGPVHHFYKFWS